MKATQDQLDKQREQLKSFLEKAEFEHITADGLLRDLAVQLSVFRLCMERLATGDFDTPGEEELSNLSLFYCDLHHNLEIALELLDMTESTEREFLYNSEEKGDFLKYISLKHKFNGEQK